jgi:hypothetical protein
MGRELANYGKAPLPPARDTLASSVPSRVSIACTLRPLSVCAWTGDWLAVGKGRARRGNSSGGAGAAGGRAKPTLQRLPPWRAKNEAKSGLAAPSRPVAAGRQGYSSLGDRAPRSRLQRAGQRQPLVSGLSRRESAAAAWARLRRPPSRPVGVGESEGSLPLCLPLLGSGRAEFSSKHLPRPPSCQYYLLAVDPPLSPSIPLPAGENTKPSTHSLTPGERKTQR